jgi:uncharacterized membrane protein
MRINVQDLTKCRPGHVMLALTIAGAVISSAAVGQTVTRSAKGEPGKDIRVGVFINVKQDCSSGPLPTIRLVEKPANGSVTVKSAKINAKNYKQCLALEVPAYVAFYKSEPSFNGVDTFVIEVRFPEGRTEMQKLNVTVGAGQKEQKI